MATIQGTSDPGAATPRGMPAYLVAQAIWFVAFGVQMVVFPYLVRVVLEENEVRFGFAQMALQLPTTLLVLIGGFVADRVDGRRAVIISFCLAVGTFTVLGALVSLGLLTYGLLIAYALSVGVLSAFANPARDSLLSLMAPERSGGVQSVVAQASMAQFGGQVIGMMLAVAAPLLGIGPLLLGQAVLMAVGAVAMTRIAPRPAVEKRARGEHGLFRFMAREIGEGLSAVIASPAIAPVTICAIAMGICFMGAFVVILPLIVQSYFPADLEGAARTQIASALGVFSLCFWVGSMASAMALSRMGPLRHKGRAYLGALATGGVVLLLCAIPAPFWVFCALNFVWGLGGGVAMTLGRGIVQEHAPPEKRARVLSVFTLGLMGGGPLGAVAYGYLAHAYDPRLVVLFPGLLMLVVVACVFAFSQLRHVGDEHAPGKTQKAAV
jgi:MFS family permease